MIIRRKKKLPSKNRSDGRTVKESKNALRWHKNYKLRVQNLAQSFKGPGSSQSCSFFFLCFFRFCGSFLGSQTKTILYKIYFFLRYAKNDSIYYVAQFRLTDVSMKNRKL